MITHRAHYIGGSGVNHLVHYTFNTAEMNKLKIVNPSQGFIHQYENIKRKLLFCNAGIYFNQQCVHKKLIPRYARIKMPSYTPAAKATAVKAQTMRVREEIKFLYMKKQQLNKKLYYVHLNAANTWGNTW